MVFIATIPSSCWRLLDIQENVTPDPVLYVQSALLYTNSEGERRIRVHTWAAMTTPNFNDIIGSIDVQVRLFSGDSNMKSQGIFPLKMVIYHRKMVVL